MPPSGPRNASGGGRESGQSSRRHGITNQPETSAAVESVMLPLAGVGSALATEDRVRGEIVRGELVPVLETYSTPFPSFSLYYPQLKRASPSLRAFVNYLRALREPKRRR